MNGIIELNGIRPVMGEGCWLAPNAILAGSVLMGANCSVWFGAVVRGDVNDIVIGNNVNIQDGAVIHCTYQKTKTHIGDNVSIGHRAVVHGCTIHEDVLIGMGAIVMDNAVVETGAVVAAGAVVLENTRIPAGTIWAGVPARQVKQCEMEAATEKNRKTAAAYLHYKTWYGQ